MIGLGVSACLMASFKAFSLWFPLERQASLNAAVMVSGSLGALTATTPIGWALPALGWRGIFAGLAILVGGVAMLILATPDKAREGSTETAGEQLRALAAILKSQVFWRFAPQTAAIVGGFMALQGLWATPWLMHVGGYSRDQAAFHLLVTGGAMLAGFFAIALLVVPLRRRGIEPESILKAGMGSGIAVLALILLDLGPSHLLWFCLGLVFSVGNLAYALLSAYFPQRLSGRVNTALNLGAFVGAFGIQWGMGVLVDLLSARGVAVADAYRWAFSALLVLQVLAYGWFLAGSKPRA